MEADLLPDLLPVVPQVQGPCYQSMLMAGDMSSLLSPARAAISSCIGDFLHQDQGAVGEANDQTADSCAIHFAHWLLGKHINDVALWMLTSDQALTLICTYASSISSGEVLWPTMASRNGGVAKKTLGGYIQSFYEFIISQSPAHPAVYHSLSKAKLPFTPFSTNSLQPAQMAGAKQEKGAIHFPNV